MNPRMRGLLIRMGERQSRSAWEIELALKGYESLRKKFPETEEEERRKIEILEECEWREARRDREERMKRQRPEPYEHLGRFSYPVEQRQHRYEGPPDLVNAHRNALATSHGLDTQSMREREAEERNAEERARQLNAERAAAERRKWNNS